MTYAEQTVESDTFAELEQQRVERADRDAILYNWRLDNNIVITRPRVENNIHTL